MFELPTLSQHDTKQIKSWRDRLHRVFYRIKIEELFIGINYSFYEK